MKKTHKTINDLYKDTNKKVLNDLASFGGYNEEEVREIAMAAFLRGMAAGKAEKKTGSNIMMFNRWLEEKIKKL